MFFCFGWGLPGPISPKSGLQACMHARKTSKQRSQPGSKEASNEQSASEQASKKGRKETASQPASKPVCHLYPNRHGSTRLSPQCERFMRSTVLPLEVLVQYASRVSIAAAVFVSIKLGVVNFKTRAGLQSNIDSYAPDHNTMKGCRRHCNSYSVCLVTLRAWQRGWSFFFAIALCAHTHACAMRSSTVAAGRFADCVNPLQ